MGVNVSFSFCFFVCLYVESLVSNSPSTLHATSEASRFARCSRAVWIGPKGFLVSSRYQFSATYLVTRVVEFAVVAVVAGAAGAQVQDLGDIEAGSAVLTRRGVARVELLARRAVVTQHALTPEARVALVRAQTSITEMEVGKESHPRSIVVIPCRTSSLSQRKAAQQGDAHLIKKKCSNWHLGRGEAVFHNKDDDDGADTHITPKCCPARTDNNLHFPLELKRTCAKSESRGQTKNVPAGLVPARVTVFTIRSNPAWSAPVEWYKIDLHLSRQTASPYKSACNLPKWLRKGNISI